MELFFFAIIAIIGLLAVVLYLKQRNEEPEVRGTSTNKKQAASGKVKKQQQKKQPQQHKQESAAPTSEQPSASSSSKKRKGNKKEVDENNIESVLEFLKGKEFKPAEKKKEEKRPDIKVGQSKNQAHQHTNEDEIEEYIIIKRKKVPAKKEKTVEETSEKPKRKKAFFKSEEDEKKEAKKTQRRRGPKQPTEGAVNAEGGAAQTEHIEGSTVEGEPTHRPPRKHRKPVEAEDTEVHGEEGEEGAARVGAGERKQRPPRQLKPTEPPKFDSVYETANVDEILNSITNFYSGKGKTA